MRKTTVLLGFMTVAMATSGPAMASHICAYVNDNVNGPNAAEGYSIGPGNETVHVGPYFTNGKGSIVTTNWGGIGAPRLQGDNLYVSDAASDNITHFKINKVDCTLRLDPNLYPSGDTSYYFGDALAITPDGSTMFVGSTGDNTIYSHTIAANGSLGATVTEVLAPDTPTGFEVSPDGKTLVVSYQDFQHVCAYPISGGHLGAANCQTTTNAPTGISIDPVGACVYTAEEFLNTISEVAAFPLTGGVLGPATDYNPFGPGENSDGGILVNWDNKAIYVSNQFSAQMTIGTIASGCKLTYQAIVSDGVAGSDSPGQIAQAQIAHGYIVNGDISSANTPSMGIFHASTNGKLVPVGTGQFPLMSGARPSTVVVVGSE